MKRVSFDDWIEQDLNVS